LIREMRHELSGVRWLNKMISLHSPRFLFGRMARRVALLTWAAVGASGAAMAQSSGPRFDVMEYVVKGNAILTDAEIAAAVYPFMGPGRTVADVEAARAALEKAYQDKGYLSAVVSLPQQKVQGGEVVLDVTEAQVDRIKVTGAQYHLPSRIAQALPSVGKGVVPSFPQMQDELTQIQREGQVQLTPVISAGKQADLIDVEIKVQDELPLRGQVALNNKQSYNTKAGRLEAGLQYENLFQRGHSIGLNWSVSPMRPSDVNNLVVNYGLAVRPGSRVLLSWGHSNSNTPTEVGGATVVKGDTYGLHWRENLPNRARSIDHNLTVGLDFKNNRDSNQNVLGFTTEKPALRYPAITAAYDLASFGNDGELTTADASLTVGTEGLGGRKVDCNGTVTDQFACKRDGASPNFQVLKLGLGRKQPVFGRWTLNLQAEWQVASGPLSSQEQMGAGGVDSVRGYYDYEQVGDQGLRLRAELLTPPLLSSETYNLQTLAFFDRATVRTLEPLASEQGQVHLGSVGLGLRLSAGEGLKLAADVARPIFNTFKRNDSGAYVAASGGRGRTNRWTLSILKSF
jgi:hemolysin activation/secretion protein